MPDQRLQPREADRHLLVHLVHTKDMPAAQDPHGKAHNPKHWRMLYEAPRDTLHGKGRNSPAQYPLEDRVGQMRGDVWHADDTPADMGDAWESGVGLPKVIKTTRNHARRSLDGSAPKSRRTEGSHHTAPVPARTRQARRLDQILHMAIESTRLTANKTLEKTAGKTGYYSRLRVYPHNLLRGNKQIDTAGADRISEGMGKAQNKETSLGARVKQGQCIMEIYVDVEHLAAAKKRRKACQDPHHKGWTGQAFAVIWTSL